MLLKGEQVVRAAVEQCHPDLADQMTFELGQDCGQRAGALCRSFEPLLLGNPLTKSGREIELAPAFASLFGKFTKLTQTTTHAPLVGFIVPEYPDPSRRRFVRSPWHLQTVAKSDHEVFNC